MLPFFAYTNSLQQLNIGVEKGKWRKVNEGKRRFCLHLIASSLIH